MLPTITPHHAWTEVERDPKGDWTLLCPCEGRPINREASNRAANRAVQAMEAVVSGDDRYPLDASEAVGRIFVAATDPFQHRRTRGVVLACPRHFVQEDYGHGEGDVLSVLLVWGLDLGDRLHLRIVARTAPKRWYDAALGHPFGMVCWPDHWPHSGDPEAPSLKDDPTLWRVLYPELLPPPRPHTFQHRELLYAALDEPGDPLYWDVLADAVEEQGEDPSRERFASRLLREVILPGGMQTAPGLVQKGGAG